jgi:hypothetical protein
LYSLWLTPRAKVYLCFMLCLWIFYISWELAHYYGNFEKLMIKILCLVTWTCYKHNEQSRVWPYAMKKFWFVSNIILFSIWMWKKWHGNRSRHIGGGANSFVSFGERYYAWLCCMFKCQQIVPSTLTNDRYYDIELRYIYIYMYVCMY